MYSSCYLEKTEVSQGNDGMCIFVDNCISLLQRTGYWLCCVSIANWHKKCWIINPGNRNKNGRKIRNVKTNNFSVLRNAKTSNPRAAHFAFVHRLLSCILTRRVKTSRTYTPHAYQTSTNYRIYNLFYFKTMICTWNVLVQYLFNVTVL